jgi:Glycoside hydrolase family 44
MIPASKRSDRIAAWTCVVFATLSLDCRKLTAEPAPHPGSFEIAESVYDAGLKGAWQDWGWGTHDLSKGSARIDMSQYGGWIIHHDPLSTHYGALVFRMLAPNSFGRFLRVQLANGNGDKSLPLIDVGTEHTQKLAGGWLEVYLDWKEIDPGAAPFDRITLQANAAVAPDFVQFDKILLTRFKPQAASPAARPRSVQLSVNCRAPGHPISPFVYGVAQDPVPLSATARRWGGNPTTRYNWQLAAYNVGKDWYFENGKFSDYRTFLAENAASHVASALTIPTIGWVAKDSHSFGFPISVHGPQRAHDPNRPDAGDGTRPDGVAVWPGDPKTTSVEAPPDMMQKWVEAIRAEDARTKTRSVQLYILDNEPALWNSTHRDVHPNPVTYDELLDRTLHYSAAIRAADPKALIAGPAEWGWTGYLYSAADATAGVGLRPDRRAHGDVPLIPWYLKKLHEHDLASGTRALDVLDVHFYPQGEGIYSPKADPDTAARRLRSTRALWDATYTDESWIKEPIRLIPRLKEWIRQNYPGLALSIGEYNFGAEQHMSGGLALAEALGRFGTEGVDYAFYWFTPPKDSPAYWAFRAYRNFDGKGGQFLGQAMVTQMTSSVSLFASRDPSGKHLVLIALNLDPSQPAAASIALDGCSPLESRHKYVLSEAAANLVDEGEKLKAALDETLAPYSLNVFDIKLK